VHAKAGGGGMAGSPPPLPPAAFPLRVLFAMSAPAERLSAAVRAGRGGMQ